MVHAVLAGGKVIVIRLVGIDSRTNGFHTGAADGAGGKTGILIGVVGTVHLLVESGLVLALQRQGIIDGGIQLQIAVGLPVGGVHTVIEDGGDVLALGLVADALLFDDGGHGNDLIQRVAAGIDIRHQLVVKLADEVGQHGVDVVHGGLFRIKGLGGGEQEALHTVHLAQHILLQEAVALELEVGAGVLQLLTGGDTGLRQDVDDLIDGLALGDDHLDPAVLVDLVQFIVVHVLDQAAVIHIAVQLPFTRVDGLAGVEEYTAEFEEATVIDQAGFLQLLGHIAYAVALLHGDGDLHIVLVQRAQVVEQQPAHAGQQAGDQYHAGQIQCGP